MKGIWNDCPICGGQLEYFEGKYNYSDLICSNKESERHYQIHISQDQICWESFKIGDYYIANSHYGTNVYIINGTYLFKSTEVINFLSCNGDALQKIKNLILIS